MKSSPRGTLGAGLAAAALAMSPADAGERASVIGVGATTRAPIGWVEFCSEYAPECETRPLEPRDVVLTGKACETCSDQQVDTVKAITDLEHWGVVARWGPYQHQ